MIKLSLPAPTKATKCQGRLSFIRELVREVLIQYSDNRGNLRVGVN